MRPEDDTDILGNGQKPALQVICLGSSGGPCEENVTGFLVRSVHNDWARGSLLAVDAGSHLAPIVRILERDFPSVVRDGHTQAGGDGFHGLGAAMSEPTALASGPFAGMKLPYASARANALHVMRSYVSAYLITHPHLDHISGFAINTAGFHATSKPKTLAALPMVVDAIKQHIFNDVIWPNLTDEDGGVGFVTFQRLKEGGDVMVGDGEGRGYIDVVDGLGVRAFKISHGVATKMPPSHQHHRGSISGFPDAGLPVNGDASQPMTRSVSLSQHQQFSTPGTPGLAPRQSFFSTQVSPRMSATAMDIPCVVDSTAFFIRDDTTQREVLMFGDLEPDSISLHPRNRIVWQEAARKIAHGLLRGIFIECSYEDSQGDGMLFGHLCPRHVIAELQVLASLVSEVNTPQTQENGIRKRKRSAANGQEAVVRHSVAEAERQRSRSLAGRRTSRDARRRSMPENAALDAVTTTSPASIDHVAEPASPHTVSFSAPHTMTAPTISHPVYEHQALKGLKVVVIHIKDTFKDGPLVGETILAQLQQHESNLTDSGAALGCDFEVASSGESYWF